MIQGKLLRGAHGQAACLGGHLPVDFCGRACTCGNIGCAGDVRRDGHCPAFCARPQGSRQAHSPPSRNSTSMRSLEPRTKETRWRSEYDSDALLYGRKMPWPLFALMIPR